jgi:c(7)-type cytochrome triheme protein
MRFALRATPILLAVALATAAQAGKIPDEITLSNGNSRMGDVRFPHRVHFKIPGVRCMTCHGREGGTASEIPAVHAKMKDAHQFCIDCHRQQAAGPVEKCTDCHGERKSSLPERDTTAQR